MDKKLAIVLLACLLTACGMTPAQKKWAAIGVGVVATGMIIAHQDSATPPPQVEPEPRAWK